VRSGRPTIVAVVLVVAIAVLASCGIPVDGRPRPVANPQTRDNQPTPGAGTTPVMLYYVRNDHLTGVVRVAPDNDVETVLGMLTNRDGVERSEGTVSQIPRDTEVRSVSRKSSTLRVDLSSEFDNVVGQGRQLAAAQILMTVTELSDIERARFTVEGREITMPSPTRGDRVTVDPCDYLPLLPTDDQMRLDGTGIDAARRISFRRRILINSCPPPTISGSDTDSGS